MRKHMQWLVVGCGALTLVGCGSLGTILDFLNTDEVTVELVNTSADFEVDAVLYYDNEQNTTESLLRNLGTRLERTIAPGSTSTFSRDCDDLQALMVDDADLRVIAGVSPETDTGVLRDGDDFNCGDTVTFTFTHGVTLIDFDVEVDVR